MNARCFDETPDIDFQLGTLRDKLWPVEGSDYKNKKRSIQKICAALKATTTIYGSQHFERHHFGFESSLHFRSNWFFHHRENELLKHQLRKYVSAVQMLRSQAGKVNGKKINFSCHIIILIDLIS